MGQPLARRGVAGRRPRFPSLPDRIRLDPLLLFAWAELSYEEIAEALELPVGTVKSRMRSPYLALLPRGQRVPGMGPRQLHGKLRRVSPKPEGAFNALIPWRRK